MNVNDILSDPIWQGISVLLSVIVSFVLYKLQEKKKRLSYKILYSQSLFTVDKEVQNQLKITYNGLEVSQLNVFEIKIINDGKLPIKKEDFESPIELILENCTLLFDMKITEQFPQNLKVMMSLEDKRILFDRLLLNPKDFFKARIIFDGKNPNYSISARVEGVSNMTVSISSEDVARSTMAYVLTGLTALIFGGVVLAGVVIISFALGEVLSRLTNIPMPVFSGAIIILTLLYIKKKFF